MFNFNLLTLTLISFAFCALDIKNDTGQLLTVVVVFRHGDRVIINPYPSDPYKNASYWPVGFGQLTNEGKLQMFELGQWFRNRYKNFLPEEYSEKDVYVRSTDVDRTLMSAEVNLAGLYPPLSKQMWDRNLSWQPIPIHTKSQSQDVVLGMEKPCAKYNLLLNNLMNSPEFKEINRKNHDLYADVSQNTGAEIDNFDSLEFVYSNLVIERLYNFTLPEWTKSVFPDKMRPVADFSFAVPCYTPELARLRAGPFIHELLENLFNVTVSVKRDESVRKLWMYSGHDVTIANILQSLRMFEYHSPPYTATILFELRYSGGKFFVNVLYKNSSEPQAMTLKGCDFNCPLEEFVELLDPINLGIKDWYDACEISLTALLEIANPGEIALALGVLLLTIILLAIIIKVIYSRYRRSSMIYLRLPDDDDHV